MGVVLSSEEAKTLDETIISIFTFKTESQESDSFTSKGVLMASQKQAHNGLIIYFEKSLWC